MTSINFIINSNSDCYYDEADANEFPTHIEKLYEFHNVNGENVKVISKDIIGSGAAGVIYKVQECAKKIISPENEKGESSQTVSKKHSLSDSEDVQKSHKKRKFSHSLEETPSCFETMHQVRTFALKVFFDKEENQEFAIGKRFDHPHIVKIFDYSENASSNVEESYMLMEYIEGVTLSERLKNDISLEEFLKWTSQFLSALTHCFEKKALPVDIKEENMMVNRENDLKLIDFNCYCTFETFEDEDLDYESVLPPDFFTYPEVTSVIWNMIEKCPSLSQQSEAIKENLPDLNENEYIIDAFESYLKDFAIWLEMTKQIVASI